MKSNEKLKAKEIFIIAALILFLIPGLCAMYSGVHRAVEKFSDPEKKYQDVVFAKEYPFPDGVGDVGLTAADESTLLRKYLAVADKLTNYIDNYSGKSNIVLSCFELLFCFSKAKKFFSSGTDLIRRKINIEHTRRITT